MSIQNDTIGNALSDEDGMAPDKSPLDGWLDNLLSGNLTLIYAVFLNRPVEFLVLYAQPN
jgi:hypothetical protein